MKKEDILMTSQGWVIRVISKVGVNFRLADHAKFHLGFLER